MNFKLIKGFGDYSEITETTLPLEEGVVFSTYKEAEIASNEYVEAMQAYKCNACGGINQECPDCSGTGWL